MFPNSKKNLIKPFVRFIIGILTFLSLIYFYKIITFRSEAVPIPHGVAENLVGIGDIYPGRQMVIESFFQINEGSDTDLSIVIENGEPTATTIEYKTLRVDIEQYNETPLEVSGGNYISDIYYDLTIEGTTFIYVTWYITFDWDWIENTNIRYGLKAVDLDFPLEYTDYTDDIYSYENDLTFIGNLRVTGNKQGLLTSGDWVKGEENITWLGLKVVYEGTTDLYPDDSFFDIRVSDDDTGEWIDTISTTSNFLVTSTSDSITDVEDVHNIDIINIPTGGSDVSSQTFTLKVDATVPNVEPVTGSIENDSWQRDDSGPTLYWTDPQSLTNDVFYITNNDSTPSADNYQYVTLTNSIDLPEQGIGVTTIKIRPMTLVGTYGEAKTFTIKYDNNYPNNVDNLSAEITTNNSLLLSWNNPTDDDFYKTVIRKSNIQIPTTILEGDSVYQGSDESFTDTNINAGNTYYYSVFTVDQTNLNSSGVSVTITIPNNTSQSQTTESDIVLDEIDIVLDEIQTIDLEEEALKKIPTTISIENESISFENFENLQTISNSSSTFLFSKDELENSHTEKTLSAAIINLNNTEYLLRLENNNYKKTITIPSTARTYNITLKLIYTDQSYSEIETELEVLAQGFLYDQKSGISNKISNATINLYTLDDKLRESLWTKNNPQTTNENGNYYFIVEPGFYKLKIMADSYENYESDWISIRGNIFNEQIGLTPTELDILPITGDDDDEKNTDIKQTENTILSSNILTGINENFTESKEIVEENKNFVNATIVSTGVIQSLITTSAIGSTQVATTTGMLISNNIGTSTSFFLGLKENIKGLIFAIFKRKKRSYGLVYDKETQKPLSFTIINAYNKSGEFVKSEVTDIEGRFAMQLDKGEYYLEIPNKKYCFNPSQPQERMKFVKAEEGTVSLELPIYSINSKKKIIILLSKFISFIKPIFSVISTIGLILNILMIVINFNLFAVFGIAIFVLSAIWNISARKDPRHWGKILDQETNEPIKFAKVEILNNQKEIIDLQLTDEKGRYGFRNNYEGMYVNVYAIGYESIIGIDNAPQITKNFKNKLTLKSKDLESTPFYN